MIRLSSYTKHKTIKPAETNHDFYRQTWDFIFLIE